MLENEEKKIIQMLIQANKPLTSEELSFAISMSSKTIRRRLKELEALLEEHGARILSRKGIGFQLQIMDDEKFQSFQQSHLLDMDMHLQKSNQLRNLINVLLAQGDYVKADDLADVLFVSKSKLSQMLKEVRSILQTYDLSIQSKPYYGLKIEGTEFNFRRFISSYYAQDYQEIDDVEVGEVSYFDNERYEQVRLIVEAQLEAHQYAMPFNIVKSLITHLYIILIRLEKGMSLQEEMTFTNYEMYEVEYALAKDIITQLEAQFQISFPQSECEYLLIHIISKRVMDITETNKIPTNINVMVDQILQRIKETSNLDLTKDLDLRIMLGLHLVPLLTRLSYHMEMKNPILEEVRARCVAGYDLAILCAKVIHEATGFTLSEHEISYFALHFDVALNRGSEQIRKKHILVICSSGRASAQLLKFKFQNLFSKYLEHIDVCDASEAQSHIELNQYDYIFTTIPWTFDTLIPVFEFQFFLNDDSVHMIRSVLNGDIRSTQILQYFRRDMFFGIQNLSTKEEVLTYMLEQLQKVEELPEDFARLVWERESVYGTDIMPQVALPHPNQVITKDTFISVVVLKKPILWNRNKVRMVFLISIAREDSEKYKFLFEWLINLLSNSQAVKRIAEQGSYTALQQELLQLETKEK